MEPITGKHVPMLLYALFFGAGILLSEYTGISYTYPLITGILSVCFMLYRIRSSHRGKLILLAAALLIISMMGCMRYTLFQNSQSPVSLPEQKYMRVASFPERKTGSLQFEAQEEQGYFSFFDERRCMVRCTDTTATVRYGDLLEVHTPYLPLDTNAIPYQFDYSAYLRSKGIHFRLELCSLQTIPNASSGWFYHWITNSRTTFKQTMSVIFETKASRALAESLLLGYRDELEHSTKDAFQNSGVSHLLAVSGMHTALIYQMVFLFFLPLGSSQKHRFVFLICALGVLIYFTILSGCTTSVLRSAIMCGTFAIGYTFRKKGTGLNTLGTSIFIMLWMNPYQIHDIGFQLSVMAVFGILTIHRSLSVYTEHKSKLIRYILESISICISAQIMTLPVILYHFHSFPLYFIPANLLLIPISTLALFSTMVALLLAGAGIKFTLFFTCCQWLIEAFEWCARFFASLPSSVIHPVSFTSLEALLTLTVIACYLFSSSLKRIRFALPVFLCVCWSGYRIYQEHIQSQRNEEYMIHNYKRSALLVIHGHDADLFSIKEYSPRECKNMQDYFTLTQLKIHTAEKGIAATRWTNEKGLQRIWLHKNCIAADTASCSHIFYSGNIVPVHYQPEQLISLNKKSMQLLP